MTLAEKIAALRGERKLSQGDLAERLDVSRQSVSKWETGQAVPELEKIIKLADLFGVSVDELVREDGTAQGERAGGEGANPSEPEAPPAAEPEVKIVYVERRFTTVQTLGIILIAGGLAMMLCAAFVGGDPLLFIGGALAIAGAPLLLVKKHPFLATGWVVWAGAYLLLCNPAITGASWQPFWGIWAWCPLLGEGYMPPVVWLLWLAYLGESVLTIALPAYTGWLCWKRRRTRTAGRQEQQMG